MNTHSHPYKLAVAERYEEGVGRRLGSISELVEESALVVLSQKIPVDSY